MRTVNLDGGDLGVGDFTIQINEFPLVVKIASRILSDATKFVRLGLNERLSFAIRIAPSNPKLLTELINFEEKDLPANVRFYEVDRNKLFDFRGHSGGITTAQICYLITR